MFRLNVCMVCSSVTAYHKSFNVRRSLRDNLIIYFFNNNLFIIIEKADCNLKKKITRYFSILYTVHRNFECLKYFYSIIRVFFSSFFFSFFCLMFFICFIVLRALNNCVTYCIFSNSIKKLHGLCS